MSQLISIVVPCFNEAEVIAMTLGRLSALAAKLPDYRLEILCVDDGSRDATVAIITDYAAAHTSEPATIRLIKLSRNFGHQIAVTAGVDNAEGDAVVLIDADLQDPPETILDMVAAWESGFDVVYGTRTHRHGESVFKLATAGLFYRLLNRMADVHIPLDTGDFRLMSRRVVRVLSEMPERDRFVRGMVSWVGFRQCAIPYVRDQRAAGESKYPLRKMLGFALDGLLSFSSKPLQLSIGLGAASAFMALLGVLWVLYIRIFTATWVSGWATVMIAVLFIGGVQLLSAGIIGEYVGRIYKEVKRRPLYVLDQNE